MPYTVLDPDPEPRVRYYHGGRGGLAPGQLILPPSVTGYLRPQRMLRETGYRTPSLVTLGLTYRERRARWSWLLDKGSYEDTRVYVTTDAQLAANHAAGWQNWAQATEVPDPARPAWLPPDRAAASVYEVEPRGRIDADEDYTDGTRGRCCCGRRHPGGRPCCWSCDSARILAVYADVQAVDSPIWEYARREIGRAYRVWRQEVSGHDWHQGQ